MLRVNSINFQVRVFQPGGILMGQLLMRPGMEQHGDDNDSESQSPFDMARPFTHERKHVRTTGRAVAAGEEQQSEQRSTRSHERSYVYHTSSTTQLHAMTLLTSKTWVSRHQPAATPSRHSNRGLEQGRRAESICDSPSTETRHIADPSIRAEGPVAVCTPDTAPS